MLNPGSVTSSGEWAEPTSLARAIEDEMVADELIDLAEDTEEMALQRRRTLAATARGIISYLKANMDVTVDAGTLRGTGETAGQLPAANRTFAVVAGQVTIGAGTLRGAAEAGMRIPATARVLSGKVS